MSKEFTNKETLEVFDFEFVDEDLAVAKIILDGKVWEMVIKPALY